MKLFTLLLTLIVVLFMWDSVRAQRCQTVCFSDFNPVCGSTRRGGRFIHCNFSNQCEFNKHRCMSRENWASRGGRCPRASGRSDCPQNL